MPCQVSGQSVWMNSSKLEQPASLRGAGDAGPGAGAFWADAAWLKTKNEASAAGAPNETARIRTLSLENAVTTPKRSELG
jgi:hypothetical protein